MHARELVELAAIVSAHGPVLVRERGRIPDSCMEAYWVASKSRLDRWAHALRRFRAAGGGSGRKPCWPTVRGVIEEIITGEVLTRVWAAVTCAYDRRYGSDDMEPIARSVLIGHLEARHRVLTLLVHGPSIEAEHAVKLNRLRRRTERWTDLLIGYLMGLDDVSEFAIDPERARDFSEDLSCRCRLPGGRFAWPLMLASLRTGFVQGLGAVSPNGQYNAQIAVSILSAFPPDVFDSTGILRSLWLERLSHAAHDTQGMIDELLAMDEAANDER
jgi:hypothetical protein